MNCVLTVSTYCSGGGLDSVAESNIRMIAPEHEQLSQT